MVPWNASWSAEDAYEVRPCRWAGGKLAIWSPHKPGEGRPIFAKPHMTRQRRSVVAGLCTVCGEPTGQGYYDRWWFGLGRSLIEEGFAWSTTESPVHRRCADVALSVCPHLKKLGVEPEPFPAGSVKIFAIVGGPAMEKDYFIDLRGRKVIGHAKFAWKYMPRLAGAGA